MRCGARSTRQGLSAVADHEQLHRSSVPVPSQGSAVSPRPSPGTQEHQASVWVHATAGALRSRKHSRQQAGCSHGRGRQFIKMVNGGENTVIADCYRREACRSTRQSPQRSQHRACGGIEERDDWVGLGFDAVDGRHMPREPWQPTGTGRHPESPSDGGRGAPYPSRNCWNSASSPSTPTVPSPTGETSKQAAARRHPCQRGYPLQLTQRLAELETQWRKATAGDAVLHHDLRQDNLLIDSRGAAWICDWN
jgi:hypothetical protein